MYIYIHIIIHQGAQVACLYSRFYVICSWLLFFLFIASFSQLLICWHRMTLMLEIQPCLVHFWPNVMAGLIIVDTWTVEASHGTPKNDLGNDSSIGYLMFVSFRSKFLGLQPLLLLLFSFLAIHCCTATWLKRKQGKTPVHKHVYTLWLTTIALVKHFELLRVRGIVSHSWCFSSCNVRRCYHRVESSFPNGTEFRTVILIYCRHIYERREPYEIKHIFVENHAKCLSWVS
jgi:hypothetical protein